MCCEIGYLKFFVPEGAILRNRFAILPQLLFDLDACTPTFAQLHACNAIACGRTHSISLACAFCHYVRHTQNCFVNLNQFQCLQLRKEGYAAFVLSEANSKETEED